MSTLLSSQVEWTPHEAGAAQPQERQKERRWGEGSGRVRTRFCGMKDGQPGGGSGWQTVTEYFGVSAIERKPFLFSLCIHLVLLGSASERTIFFLRGSELLLKKTQSYFIRMQQNI